ncbi:hypothetical protein ANCDUO_01562 [Ancylostoma duodenale]|uniref:Uncharacterized protein n=1 Tax=Ancylostoma duodenale TaxID=51022 RepID=A0A0C2HEZ0_9BILA|nr:hypothetical protein ANCDUO_01562 [Ancylostoma duodenale]
MKSSTTPAHTQPTIHYSISSAYKPQYPYLELVPEYVKRSDFMDAGPTFKGLRGLRGKRMPYMNLKGLRGKRVF